MSEKGSTEDFVHSGNLHGIIVGVLGLFFTVLLQAKGYLPSGMHVVPIGGFIAFMLGRTIARTLLNVAAHSASGIYNPSGDSTKYTPTYSHVEALEARGDLEGAAAAYDRELLQDEENAILRVRVADFHLRARKDAATALTHYQRARALGTGSDDLRRYIQQKLVDLYLGPLSDEGKAMVELRRLIDGFPDTREAESARAALAELKAAKRPPDSQG